MNTSAAYWINKLGLVKHPEGGYFIQTYKTNEIIPLNGLPDRFTGARVFSTAIYYLLPGEEFSAFHRIKSDEVWHYYTGSSLTLHIIDLNGEYSRIVIGGNAEEEQVFQAVVKAGCWFGATVDDTEGYTLVGCTVAPGFESADFELAKRDHLDALYPQHRQIIDKLTRF